MSRDLTALFDPASVAVLGASDDPAKYGHAIAVQALRANGRRPLHLVNRRGGTVLGRTAATSLGAIGEPVELVVVSVPQAGFEDALDEALDCGARAIVAITAGFAELGAAGLARQRAAAEKVRAAGALLVGPNCLGIADNTTELYLASDRFAPGGVALLSQSGNLALELQLRLEPQGLGFSRFVSLGNQADVTLVDLVEDCARHQGTRAIAVYAEDFGDGRAFAEAAARAGKPVVLLTAGRGDASARSAKSHTGALTTSSDVVLAACRDAGIELTRTPRELACVLGALDAGRRARGRRVAVFTDGGGHGSIAADAVEAAALAVPELSTPLQRELTALLWQQSAVGNPVDLAGMGEQDPMSYARTVQALLDSDEVDAVLLTGYFGGYAVGDGGLGGSGPTGTGPDEGGSGLTGPADGGAAEGAVGDSGPGGGGSGAEGPGGEGSGGEGPGGEGSGGEGSGGEGSGGEGSGEGGSGEGGSGDAHEAGASGGGGALSALGAGELAAAEAIATAVTCSGKPLVVQSMYPASVSCRTLAAVGIPVHEAVEDAARALLALAPDGARPGGEAPGIQPLPPAAAPLADPDYHATRRLLEAADVPFPPAREIGTEDELRAAARAFPGPYVLKALHLLHKSDAGGVVLRLADEEALVAAHREMHARLGAPSYSVEAMADLTDGVELIVGVNRDPRFGPVAMVGLGGVLTEALGDVVFALAPVTAEHAERLLRSLRSAVLLDGVRGRPAVDVTAAAHAVAAITAVAAAHPEIAELEVNPLLVTPRGALALDSRAVLGS